MPKKAIDYSNTMFYKIVCNDLSKKELYVGHTTNWNKRKVAHKARCNSALDTHSNLPLYAYIKANGGFDNFSMILIEKCDCADNLEAGKRERQLIELYEANLNCRIPTRTSLEWHHENKERNNSYREANKEHKKKVDKQYREKNKDKVDEYRKQWVEQNKEALAEYKRVWYQKQKEQKALSRTTKLENINVL